MKRLFLFFLFLCSAAPSFGKEAKVMDLRYWTAPDHTRIVFDLSKRVDYRLLENRNPRRIEVEFPGTKSLLQKDRIEIRDGLIKEIIIKAEETGLRVIVEVETPTNLSIFPLKKYLYKPERVVIDVLRPQYKEKMEVLWREVERLKRLGTRIVVIDPGHGGEDPGAIGRVLYLKEKDVVLDISKRIVEILNKINGIKAFLTRDGDYFVPLRKRVKIARGYNADLFISIHTNANHSIWERGSSVYTLSLKGASDEASRLLAERENASDLIGGIADTEDDTLAMILLDLAQTATLNDSLAVATLCMNRIASIGKTENDGVKRAGFVVLKAVDIPSILVETAFISNPEEEALLATEEFRDELARMISLAALDYLGLKRKEEPLPIKVAKENPPNRYHIVKDGETLWRIAQMYKVTLSLLREINGLGESNRIYIGQRLIIP